MGFSVCCIFFFQAENGIRDLVRSRGLGDVYKRQIKIQAQVQSIGYRLIIPDEHVEERQAEAQRKQYKKLRTKVIFAWIFAVPLMIIAMGFMHWKPGNWIMLALVIPIMFYSGRDFYIRAWRLLRKRTANMDTLVSLSTIVAFLFSLFNTLFPGFLESRGIEVHVYYEAAGMILAFVLLGGYTLHGQRAAEARAAAAAIQARKRETLTHQE